MRDDLASGEVASLAAGVSSIVVSGEIVNRRRVRERGIGGTGRIGCVAGVVLVTRLVGAAICEARALWRD